ncbi:MAG TPA: phosphate propanoyltransferase [Opitutaceae bacterium]|nr:phosphate propanoyltransferase [Opitutaceae bacterium]
MSSPATLPHREEIAHVVRRILYQKLQRPMPRSVQAPRPLLVNVSARHCHLTPQAVETLFGRGHQLTPKKWLYQDGQYAAEECVTLIGPRSRVISNLRILGPCRELNQVELAFTDAISLGFEIPVRASGNIKGTPGCMLMGPAGFLELEEGVIRAAPHVHMHPDDAAFYGVKPGAFLRLRIGGDCGLTFDRMLVRVSQDFKLEVHIDTDEANACGLIPGTLCELLP